MVSGTNAAVPAPQGGNPLGRWFDNRTIRSKILVVVVVVVVVVVAVAGISSTAIGIQSLGTIMQISTVIEQINDLQTTIASAVEEQTATTNEISRNISEAAVGSGGIAVSITAVASAAASTRAGVVEARTAASDLARMSTDLQKLVTGFRY